MLICLPPIYAKSGVVGLLVLIGNNFLYLQFLRRVFSIDTIVKPLPPALAYNVSRNLSFFTRIFTQFFGKFFYSFKFIFMLNSINVLLSFLDTWVV